MRLAMTDLTRRRAFGVIATVPAAAGAIATGAQAQGAASANVVTLLLVNDIYKMGPDKGRGGFAKLAAIVAAERKRGNPMLYAHAGDMFSPSLMSGFDQGAHTVELLNMAAPDIFVPGNHEFDFGKDVFFKRMGESKFPYFAANMRQADGSPVAGVKDNAIVELGPVKVGLLGLALENTAQVSSPGDLKFLSVMDTVRAQAKALRDGGADIIVAVSHTDRATDNQIIRSRLVDILLTGHDHDLALAYDGRTVMVESNEEGNYVTAIDLTLTITGEGKDRKVAWSPSFRINDSKDFMPDPRVDAKVKEYEAALSKELDVEVGVLGTELDSRSASVRGGETAIGNLIADAIRETTGADVALTNGGGIRANKQYPVGHKLTRRDILSELPFGNRTVMAQVKGEDLKAALENGVSQIEQRAGRMPQVSGMVVEVDASKPAGSRIVSVVIGAKPLDQNAVYTVATNDFMLKGGDGYATLGKLTKDTDLAGKLMANDVMIHARKLGTISAKIEGRIVVKR
jgi:5'-nucleotidase / UDP-sugar diphosphatase